MFRHTHTLRVTYADCTLGNHVYYGRYLDFLEAARGELFRAAGRTFEQWQNEGAIFPVLEVQLRYRAPARYDDVVRVETSVIEAAGIRLAFGYRVLRSDGTLCVEGETRHVCTSLEERPRRLPADLIQRLTSAPPGSVA